MGWNRFFHARAPHRAFILAGWIRVAYGFLFVADRLLLTLDFHKFFATAACLLPFKATPKSSYPEITLSLFEILPDIPASYWFMHIQGIVQALLLMLGVAPRFQLLGLYVNMLTFHHHNDLIWDGEDVMFRVWCVLLFALPLHHVTIYDTFGFATWKGKRDTNNDDSWSMWPFRLWQIETCFIYLGAGFGKLASERWRLGNAMWHISHETDFFGGPFTPDLLFNRYGPLKFMTWSSLLLETTCWVFIWPRVTRIPMLVSMLLLHIGIELSMNMHCFEWLTILGWLTFLVEPDFEEPSTTPPPASSMIGRIRVNAFLVCILGTLFVDTFPMDVISLFPESTATERFHNYHSTLFHSITPYLAPIGLLQRDWTLFSGASNAIFHHEALFRYENNTEASWRSPDWRTMTWLEKKRWQRPMTFYENLAYYENLADNEFNLVALAQYLMTNDVYGPPSAVLSVQFLLHTQAPPEYPPMKQGFWTPVVREYEESTERRYTLNICDDVEDSCDLWSRQGYCDSEDDRKAMMEECRWSCNWCLDVGGLLVGTRIAIYFRDDQQFFDATLKEIKQEPVRVLVEYDDHDGGEQLEWLDAFKLRHRGIVFHESGEEAAAGEIEEDDEGELEEDDEDELEEENDNWDEDAPVDDEGHNVEYDEGTGNGGERIGDRDEL